MASWARNGFNLQIKHEETFYSACNYREVERECVFENEFKVSGDTTLLAAMHVMRSSADETKPVQRCNQATCINVRTSVSTMRWLFCIVRVMMLPFALLALAWWWQRGCAATLGGPDIAGRCDEPRRGDLGVSFSSSTEGVTVDCDSLPFSCNRHLFSHKASRKRYF